MQVKQNNTRQDPPYRPRRPANDNDVVPMRLIDELFTAWPFCGSTASACSG
jgi:hypothetical protein